MLLLKLKFDTLETTHIYMSISPGWEFGLNFILILSVETVPFFLKFGSDILSEKYLLLFFSLIKNTPGTRGWSRLRDRTLAVKSRKIARKSAFVKKTF